jgi:hypothetical protein
MFHSCSGEKIKVTLWGDILVNMVDEDLMDKQTIIIVTSNFVRDFYGEIFFLFIIESTVLLIS